MRGVLLFGLVLSMASPGASEACVPDPDTHWPRLLSVPQHGVAYTSFRRHGSERVGFGVHRYTYGDPYADDAWKRPSMAPRVIDATFHRGPLIVLEIDQVIAAVRVEWTGVETQRREYIVPFYTIDSNAPPSEHVLIRLGLDEDDCLLPFDLEPLEAGARMKMTVIRHDGSEAPLLGVPAWLTPIVEPTPEPRELVDTWDLDAFADELVAFITMRHLPSWLDN